MTSSVRGFGLSLLVLFGASSPATVSAQTFSEFLLPTANSQPGGIAAGSDGNLWFTEWTGNKIGRITTAGVITEFSLPVTGGPPGLPAGIASGSDGNLWFTEQIGRVGRITTAGGITEFSINYDGPAGIAAGPDGNLWFTVKVPIYEPESKICRITPAGVVTQFGGHYLFGSPHGIAAGSDGNLWITEITGNKITRISTAGAITPFSIPTAGSGPIGITAGPDGNLWFTEGSANKIGRITTAGVITEFSIPTANSVPRGIAAGPDGNLWFTEGSGNKIGRITTAGVITEFSIPTAGSGPTGIAAGQDGSLWFTESTGNKIGRITPAASACPNGAPRNISFSFLGQTSSCRTSSSSCVPGEAIAFTLIGGSYLFQTCDTFSWDFGDGTVSSSPSPWHSYLLPGVYTVHLTVSNAAGSTRSQTTSIFVGEVPRRRRAIRR